MMRHALVRLVLVVHLLVLLAATACSQQVYSPPSQPHGLGPIAALPEHRRTLDVELSSHAQIFDPAIGAGTGRLRVGVGDDTEVSIEGSALAVQDRGPSRADRTLYAGRVGVRTNPGGQRVAAMFVGAGGGFAPAGGSFAAIDGGVALGYHNCVLVPIAMASAFLSEPLRPRPIDVTTSRDAPTFDTPRRTIGGVLRAGLRLSLAPAACRRGDNTPWLTGALGLTAVADADSSAALLGVGLGIEIPLD